MNKYVVYIRTDAAGRVIEINSDAFLRDADGWTQIASGHGDKFHHAQGNYLPLPLMDERGVYRYKLEEGAIVERTEEEMDSDWVEPEQRPSVYERISALESAFEKITAILNKLGVK